MTFAEKIKSLREGLRLTQQELADVIYVSRSAVAKWESGRGIPNADAVEAMSVLFGINKEELLSEKERKIFRRGRRACMIAAGFGVTLPVLFFVFCTLPLFRYGIKPGMWPTIVAPPLNVFDMCGGGVWRNLLIVVLAGTVISSVLTATIPRFSKSSAIAVRNIVIALLVALVVFVLVVSVAVIRSEMGGAYGFIFLY